MQNISFTRVSLRHPLLLLLLAACLKTTGCGRGDGLQMVVVHGTVTCGDERVELGEIRFIPIAGTPGPTSHSAIIDGGYIIEARGGVPVGRHRVEVEASRKTGRQVLGYDGMEEAMIDETERLSPPKYSGETSPLTAEVTADSDGKFDFELPASL